MANGYTFLLVFAVIWTQADSCTITITNLKNNDKVNHKLVIFNGLIENEASPPKTVRFLNVMNLNSKSYSSKIDTNWWINTFNQFKGLIRLEKGKNQIDLSYTNGKKKCSLGMTLYYEENLTVEPLHLVIVAGKDSKLVYDVEPGEVNDYNSAVDKYRVMAWLWQAFIDDQIYKNGLGHRSFRLDETVLISGQYYPKVHLLRSTLTVAEIRSESTDLFSMCGNAVKSSSLNARKPANKPLQFACLLMDSHKLPDKNTVQGHAALGSGWSADYNYGIFGSHLLYSHPSSLKKINATFTDIRKINTKYTSNDGGDYRARVNNVGIGAFLHEIGHSLGLYHNYGIMLRGFEEFNRAFYSVELSTEKKLVSLKRGVDDLYATFSKEDCTIMSVHHLLRLKTDVISNDNDKNIQIFPLSKTSFTIYAAATVRLAAFNFDPDAVYVYSVFYTGKSKNLKIEMKNSEQLLKYKADNKAVGFLVSLKNGEMAYFDNFFKRLEATVISDTVFSSVTYGAYWSSQVDFSVKFFPEPNKYLTTIKVYYSDFVNGMEFLFSDNSTQLVGYRSVFEGVVVLGSKQIRIMRVKSGAWLDSVQFCFSITDCTQRFGGNGGYASGEFNLNLIDSPQSYRVSGISGSSIDKYDGWDANLLNLISINYEKI